VAKCHPVPATGGFAGAAVGADQLYLFLCHRCRRSVRGAGQPEQLRPGRLCADWTAAWLLQPVYGAQVGCGGPPLLMSLPPYLLAQFSCDSTHVPFLDNQPASGTTPGCCPLANEFAVLLMFCLISFAVLMPVTATGSYQKSLQLFQASQNAVFLEACDCSSLHIDSSLGILARDMSFAVSAAQQLTNCTGTDKL